MIQRYSSRDLKEFGFFLFDSPSNLLILGISQQSECRSISRGRSGVGRMTSDEECFQDSVKWITVKKTSLKNVFSQSCIATALDILAL